MKKKLERQPQNEAQHDFSKQDEGDIERVGGHLRARQADGGPDGHGQYQTERRLPLGGQAVRLKHGQNEEYRAHPHEGEQEAQHGVGIEVEEIHRCILRPIRTYAGAVSRFQSVCH